MAKSIIILACMSLLAGVPCSADIIYVKQGGTGSGTSWDDPNGLLQTAINNANSNDEVWVAAGIYKPTMEVGGSGDRYKTFQMKNGVKIYGGFPDTGYPDMADRDPNMYKTILNGEFGTTEDPNDNCYHVFFHPNGLALDHSAILDGFTVTAGNANGSGPHHYGGGMYNNSSSPTVTGCTFTGNSALFAGGGMYNYYSSPIVTNCTFTSNSAGSGGGMYNTQSSPKVTNCTFNGNSAENWGSGMYNFYYSSPTVTGCTFTGNVGGGMVNWTSSPTMSNCTFSGNSVDHRGGGMYNFLSSTPTVSNCTFTGNSAVFGGGMYNSQSSPTVTNCTFTSNVGGGMYNTQSSPTVTNCIFWGNTASNGNEIYNDTSTPVISYCDIAGSGGSSSWDTNLGTDDGGNIDSDPLFAGWYLDPNSTPEDPNDDYWVAGGGDFHLKSQSGRWDPNTETWVFDDVTSPCIDAGDPCSDYSGELWPHGKRINMGAYGGTAEASMSLSNAGNIADLNEDDEVETEDLLLFGYDWLRDEVLLKSDLDRNGRVDLRDFSIEASNWLWAEQ